MTDDQNSKFVADAEHDEPILVVRMIRIIESNRMVIKKHSPSLFK